MVVLYVCNICARAFGFAGQLEEEDLRVLHAHIVDEHGRNVSFEDFEVFEYYNLVDAPHL